MLWLFGWLALAQTPLPPGCADPANKALPACQCSVKGQTPNVQLVCECPPGQVSDGKSCVVPKYPVSLSCEDNRPCDVLIDGGKTAISLPETVKLKAGTHSFRVGECTDSQRVQSEPQRLVLNCSSPPVAAVPPPQVVPASPVARSAAPYSTTSPTLGTLVHLPGGSFTMGSPTAETDRDDDETQHPVTLSRFHIMEREVTQGMWMTVTKRHGWTTTQQAPSFFSSCGPDCPVENVSWCDAVLFANLVSQDEGLKVAYSLPSGFGAGMDRDTCNTLSPKVTLDRTAPGYRLPTEAEWEFAARGGQDYVWSGSKNVGDVAWYDGNSGRKTHATCGKTRNGYGLCDMSGNVWEWVWDWYGTYVAEANPLGALSGSYRVRRGGSWSTTAVGARVANRYRRTPGYRYHLPRFPPLRYGPLTIDLLIP